MSREEWLALARYPRSEHPVLEAIFGDPMTRRAFEKPRGYAGDAVMMDYLHGIHSAGEAEAQASDLGRAIYRYIRNRPAGQAVRFRRQHLAALIDHLAARQDQPSVLAIAAGHVREAELSRALAAGRIGRFVALDADADSLREVETQYGQMGVTTVHGSVRRILARKIEVGTFDFVYATGTSSIATGTTWPGSSMASTRLKSSPVKSTPIRPARWCTYEYKRHSERLYAGQA